jgi:hypothetical protein
LRAAGALPQVIAGQLRSKGNLTGCALSLHSRYGFRIM